jgi:hypothetical protein
VEESSRGIKNFFWAITAVVLTSPLFLLFDQQGKPGTGRAAWICAGMFLIAMKVRWELRSRPWFWIAVAVLLALHLPLILLVPWTSRWIPAVGILPIGILDLAIILGCIALVEKLVKSSQDSGEQV